MKGILLGYEIEIDSVKSSEKDIVFICTNDKQILDEFIGFEDYATLTASQVKQIKEEVRIICIENKISATGIFKNIIITVNHRSIIGHQNFPYSMLHIKFRKIYKNQFYPSGHESEFIGFNIFEPRSEYEHESEKLCSWCNALTKPDYWK